MPSLRARHPPPPERTRTLPRPPPPLLRRGCAAPLLPCAPKHSRLRCSSPPSRRRPDCAATWRGGRRRARRGRDGWWRWAAGHQRSSSFLALAVRSRSGAALPDAEECEGEFDREVPHRRRPSPLFFIGHRSSTHVAASCARGRSASSSASSSYRRETVTLEQGRCNRRRCTAGEAGASAGDKAPFPRHLRSFPAFMVRLIGGRRRGAALLWLAGFGAAWPVAQATTNGGVGTWELLVELQEKGKKMRLRSHGRR